jgi:hypothetical protein
MDDPRRRHLIAAALRRRLQEVGRRPAVPAGAPRPVGAADEERLRLTMVRLLGAGDPDALVTALEALREPARSDDLRFLDAWNAVYEALAGTAAAERMLDAYAALLHEHAERRSA